MKILFIAPLPPPITGHSLASKVLLDELARSHEVDVVNFSKNSFKEGADTFKRFLEIAKVLKNIYQKKKDVNLIYLTISESFAGNIKDLFIYLLCFSKLSNVYIHLHGGSIKKLLFDRYKIIYLINKFFIKRLAGVIVLGKSHIPIFAGLIKPEKIHIIPNFAEDHLFVSESEIVTKFDDISALKILFLSNLIFGKGHTELLDAYMALDKCLQGKIRIDFAGAFESEQQKSAFLEKIKDLEQVSYHGVVHGTEKKRLLAEAHVFCLPTSLFEGQPISILEAYASGCVVVTTKTGGIEDIFQNNINGYEVQTKSAESITQTIKQMISRQNNLLLIGITNKNTADKYYRASIYKSSLKRILESGYHL